MKNLSDERRQTGQRAHLESGIFRNKIANAYFDAMKAGMKPEECVREAIEAGALTLVGNRSVELRGLSHQELATEVWKKISPNAAAMCAVNGSARRSRHVVVAVVTRNLVDAALDFLESHGGKDALAR